MMKKIFNSIGNGKLFKSLLWAYTFAILLFLLIPSFYIILISFDEKGLGCIPTHFSFKWYSKIFSQEVFMEAVRHSIYFGIFVALISVILALMAARTTEKMVRTSALLMGLMFLPLLTPAIIMGFNSLIYFNILHIGYTSIATIIVQSLWALPFAFIICLVVLARRDPILREASHDLGANELQTLIFIDLPLLKNGLIGAAVLSFTLSLNEFIRTWLVQGRATTIPTHIFTFTQTGISSHIYAACGFITLITLIFFFIASAFLWIYMRSWKKKGGKKVINNSL